MPTVEVSEASAMWYVQITDPTEEFKEFLCQLLNESNRLVDFQVFSVENAPATSIVLYLEFTRIVKWFTVGWFLQLFKDDGWKARGGMTRYRLKSLYSRQYIDAISKKTLLYQHVKHT